jgi:hypothetical protein
MRIKLIFAWYDLWIGFFWDSKKKWLYIFPIPMFGMILKLKKESKELLPSAPKIEEYFISVDFARPNTRDINVAVIWRVDENGDQKLVKTLTETDPKKFKDEVRMYTKYYGAIKIEES